MYGSSIGASVCMSVSVSVGVSTLAGVDVIAIETGGHRVCKIRLYLLCTIQERIHFVTHA